jgi:hypothetical protein
LAFEELLHGEMRRHVDDVFKVQGCKPGSIALERRLLGIQEPRCLANPRLGERFHLFACPHLAGRGAISWVANCRRKRTHQESYVVAKALKLAQLEHWYNVAEVQVAHRRVEAGVHAQGTAFGEPFA